MFSFRGLVLTSLLLGQSLAFERIALAETGAQEQSGSNRLFWQNDYQNAVKQAIDQRAMLLIYFEGPKDCTYCRDFEAKSLSDSEVESRLQKFVCLRLPSNTEIIVDGKKLMLLRHAAFAEMLGRPGIAILDLTDKSSPQFHQVVSVLPFKNSRYLATTPSSKQSLLTLLTLPKGSLTQRTMVYAVRMHPEAPASSQGTLDNALSSEAKSHSAYQATIGVQGHHNWDSRFQRINGKLPTGILAQEVVAESWPGEGLVEACEDCVHSWRQSPGHWGAVRSRHPLFAFDIKRGRNGIWYATGIFGRR